MIVLEADNTLLNTDFVNKPFHFGVLTFEDVKNPDFVFKHTDHIMAYNAAGITLEIGSGKEVSRIVVPLHWWILCVSLDEVQTIPLYELSRNDYEAFCFNPINGYRPEYLNLRVSTSTPSIYPYANWYSPPVGEKDLILIPLSDKHDSRNGHPLCVMFSTNKYEVSRYASDIWS